MISLVICSRNHAINSLLTQNVKETIGVDYELICIDNSANKYSLFSAYNEGYRRSKYPIICFVHEDVHFHSSDWGRRVAAHLQNPATGIVGLAGADAVHRVPIAWSKMCGASEHMLQRRKDGALPPEHLLTPDGYSAATRTAITLDGVMLCLRKELMDKGLLFDESLSGFHGYDYDISIRATLAGYQNLVIYDILVEHFSGGKTNQAYFRNLIALYKKYEAHLPLIGPALTPDEKESLHALERKNLKQLTHKMVRKGFGIAEIKAHIGYFADRIQYPSAARTLTVRVFLIRLFNCPKYLI